MVISPNPSLYNRELSVTPQVGGPGKHFIPAVKVLGSMYAAGSRPLRPECQDCLPGLGKVWKPVPVGRNLRKVAVKRVIQMENIFAVGRGSN